jgi:hypothetical protein
MPGLCGVCDAVVKVYYCCCAARIKAGGMQQNRLIKHSEEASLGVGFMLAVGK